MNWNTGLPKHFYEYFRILTCSSPEKFYGLVYDHFKKQPTAKNMTENEMKMPEKPYFITFSNTYILVSSSVFNALNRMESNTICAINSVHGINITNTNHISTIFK